jgi:hypothetical protein
MNQNNFSSIHPRINKQPSITYYTTQTLGNFDGIENESIMDKELTTTERIEIMKTLAYTFFNNNTLYFSYFILSHRMPNEDYLKAQFGFINCNGPMEKTYLLKLYNTCLYKCYPDMFVFKPMGILYDYFLEDRIADFIIESYSRIKYSDTIFMWFLNNKHIVKHNINYKEFMERKAKLFQKKVHF